MNPFHDLPDLPGTGYRQSVRRLYARLRRNLHLDIWFPQLPLALAIAMFGLFKISPDIPRVLGLTAIADALTEHSATSLHSALHGVQSTVVGVFLVTMAIGLLLRSKLAWVIMLLILGADLLLAILNHAASSEFLLICNALLLIALLVSYRSFQRSSLAASTLFAVTSIIALLAYSVFGSYELGAEFKPPITDLVTALYYSIETMSTVGYGDITPGTIEAKLFVISVIVLGVSIFAASLSAILVPIVNRRIARLLRPEESEMERSEHYVIVGDTALAHNTSKELLARQQQVTFIYTQAVSGRGKQDTDVVIGDPSNLEVLRLAGAHQAKAVLALSEDDSQNAFVVLAMRELAENVKTVVVVHNARNLASVKRVHPDIIISPQILGGELLAMALSGEELNSEQLLGELLHFRS
ncbi:MAG: voltage-gated potassium channel protein [Gammaproteobacteria bacterium]|nr:voltage-gated potassium channel protein [Gammaproteobacteria bacterium]